MDGFPDSADTLPAVVGANAPAAASAAAPASPAAEPARPARAASRPRKSPRVAGLLSLMPGAGQIYVGYYRLGFVHNAVFAGAIALLAANGGPFPALVPAMAIFLPFFVIYNIVDASRRATTYNLALDGVEGIDLPRLDVDLELPELGGSILGGAILIVFGAVLLSNTLLGIPLDWLAASWPVIPICLGVHVLVKALRERRAQGGSGAPEPRHAAEAGEAADVAEASDVADHDTDHDAVAP